METGGDGEAVPEIAKRLGKIRLDGDRLAVDFDGFFGFSLTLQGAGEIIQGLGMGADGGGFAEIFDGAVPVAGGPIGIGQIVVRTARRPCCIGSRCGRRKLPLSNRSSCRGAAEVKPGLGPIGPNGNGAAACRCRLSRRERARSTTARLNWKSARRGSIDASPLQSGGRASLRSAGLKKESAEEMERLRVVGFFGDCFSIKRLGLVEASGLVMGGGEGE